MEIKINIADILKDKPVGLKLYSNTFGYISFNGVHKDKVYFFSEDTNAHSVKPNGKMYDGGECIIFPSKEMRDWEKFSWKNGDVLVNSSGFKLLFDRWANDDYTRFFGKFNILEDSFSYETEKYTLVSKDETIDTFEIEKPEFKDGDIVTIINDCEQRCILIFRNIIGDSLNRYCILTKRGLFTEGYSLIDKEDSILFATEEEKKKLFSALEKEGKAWDAEKKQIVDLKPKCEFKPMDLCLMKYIGQYNNRGWELCQYAYTEHRVSSSGEQRDFYHSVGGEIYAECIPYNEDTKHLLGTKTKWKGGEQ